MEKVTLTYLAVYQLSADEGRRIVGGEKTTTQADEVHLWALS